MSNVAVMDLTKVCQSFPDLEERQINRDNYLEAIDGYFDRGIKLVLLDGEAGTGKTNLAAQYAINKPNSTISVFLSPLNTLVLDPRLLRLDICSQITWVLSHKELQDLDTIDESYLKNRLYELHRHARKNQTRYTFVIDGLKDSSNAEVVMNILSVGIYTNFQFLVTGDESLLPPIYHNKLKFQTQQILGFSLSDAIEYLSDIIENQSLIDQFYRHTKLPSGLSSIRRMIESGIHPEDLLNELPKKLPDIFEFEWQRNTIQDRETKLVLALLAYSNQRATIDYVAQMLDMPEEKVNQLVTSLTFVTVYNNNEIKFVTDAFRQFISQKLENLKQMILELIIVDLGKRGFEESALELPNILMQVGKHEEILAQLTPEHFQNVVTYGQSLAVVREQLELGTQAAISLQQYNHQIKFELLKSTIRELDSVEILQSEIEARIALGNVDAALLLANQPNLNIDKLHLLSIIAKEVAGSQVAFVSAVNEQIQNLYQQIDLFDLGERATEIAASLIYSNPEIAIELVEKSNKNNTEEDALDWALTRLTLEATNLNSDHSLATLERIRSKIVNPKVKTIATTFSLLSGDFSAEDVLMQLKNISSTRERLFLICEWAINHREHSAAQTIVERGLEVMINEANEYSPNASHFRQLATPLPYMVDKTSVRQFISKFDSQAGNIERYGPTEEYVRLRLLLAEAETTYDKSSAIHRVIEIYFYVCELPNLSLKSTCLARISVTLDEFDENHELEEEYGVHHAVSNDFAKCVDELLNTTADHFYATRKIIQALAKKRPEEAISLAKRLNTKDRRDSAYLTLVKTALLKPTSTLDFKSIQIAVESILNAETKNEAIFEVVRRIKSIESVLETDLPTIMWFLEAINGISNEIKRCNAYSLIYSWIEKLPKIDHTSYKNLILYRLKHSWESIDLGWVKIDLGFKIASTLAKYELDTAWEYIKAAEELRTATMLSSVTNASAFIHSNRLSIRAFSGLLVRQVNEDKDLLRLKDFINQIPSQGERTILWGELAIAFYLNKHKDDCQTTIFDHVLPLISSISKKDTTYYAQVISTLAPALFCAHEATAFERIAELPPDDRDMAYSNISQFILRRQSPSEPYFTMRGQGFEISYANILDLCKLLELIEEDALIYAIIENIADSIRQYRNKYNRFEKVEIAGRLKKIVNQKLPQTKDYIQHEGFRIACLAQIMKFEQSGTWQELINLANNIPNLPDRIYVLSILSNCMSNRQLKERKDLLEEAAKLGDRLPSFLDKAICFQNLADTAYEIDKGLHKQYLKSAMTAAIADDQPELFKIQRDIIDLTYNLDEDFASDLVSLVDDDPSKIDAKNNVTRQVEMLKLKSRVSNDSNKQSSFQLADEDLSQIPKMAWAMLGSLNSGRITPVHTNIIRQLFPYVGKLPFAESYPVLSWIFENIKRRMCDTDQAQEYIRPLFELGLLNTEFIGRVASHSSSQVMRTSEYITKVPSEEASLVRVGNRQQALAFLKEWFKVHADEYLKICDPYFGPEDLEVLKMVLETHPSCRVEILTSREHHKSIQQPWEDAYRNYWERAFDQRPPVTDIVIVGLEKTGKSPIHDRWWLTPKGGLRFGHSIHEIGYSRDSEISYISIQQAKKLESESVDQFLYRREREFKGERLLSTSFSL